MGLYFPIKQGTILLPSGTSHNEDQKHLFIICTDPCDEGKHLLVTMSSWRNDFCDATCILTPDNCEHSFVKHKSYILYRKSQLETAEALKTGVEKDLFVPKESMPDEPFERIRAGILQSPYTPRRLKTYYKKNG